MVRIHLPPAASLVRTWTSSIRRRTRQTSAARFDRRQRIKGVSGLRRPHCEPRGPANPPDNQGNRATARNPALGSPSHTCIERTSCRTAARVAQRRIAGRSVAQRQSSRMVCFGSCANAATAMDTGYGRCDRLAGNPHSGYRGSQHNLAALTGCYPTRSAAGSRPSFRDNAPCGSRWLPVS
jgi:hypothetical protein